MTEQATTRRRAALAAPESIYTDDQLRAIDERDRDVRGLPPLPGTLLTDVKVEQVRWLWPSYIPLGKLTVLDGDPGLGKSTMTMDLAARVTRGFPMPDGSPGIEGGAVILTAEDGLGDTVVPRFLAAGGDPNRAVALDTVGVGDDEHDPMLPDDLPAVEGAIERVNAVLVVVDPLMAFLAGNVNAHRDQDVRRALRQLSSLAERTGAALLVVRHLNKVGAGGSPLYRGGGSIGIIGAARAGLLVARDPDDKDRRVVACTKSNLGAEPASLGYRQVPHEKTVRVEWTGQHTATATALLAEPDDEETKTLVEDAMEFLRDLLASGPVESQKAKRETQKGIACGERTVMTAKSRLGIRSRKQGQGSWAWELPDHDSADLPEAM